MDASFLAALLPSEGDGEVATPSIIEELIARLLEPDALATADLLSADTSGEAAQANFKAVRVAYRRKGATGVRKTLAQQSAVSVQIAIWCSHRGRCVFLALSLAKVRG